MAIGLKFDNLIACYVTALPLLFLTIGTLCTAHRAAYARQTRQTLRAIGWYYGIVYALGLIIEVANVRYFRFFDNHLNISVVEWFGFVRDTAGMLFGDAANLVAIVVALILVGLFEWALVAIVRSACRRIDTVASSVSWQQYAGGVGLSLLLYGACFCGIRGSFQRYPLDVSFAYFCDNAFYNKLGVNPIFNIIQIPCFFVGNSIADTTLTAPAQQQDIAPTLLGLLGLPYTENTMGINALQHSRDYTYFVNNDHLGCTDGEWLYSYSINTQQE